MPKSDNQKLKILYILDHLQKNSNSSHPVKAAELVAMLKTHGIQAERKSIYSDIRALQDYGVDIITAPGKKGGYYVASRIFETPELKLLINAVQSSRFLTERKSRELIEKLCAEQNALPPVKDYETVDYTIAEQTTEELVQAGLIRQFTAAVPVGAFETGVVFGE